jgi:hypothetical protein
MKRLFLLFLALLLIIDLAEDGRIGKAVPDLSVNCFDCKISLEDSHSVYPFPNLAYADSPKIFGHWQILPLMPVVPPLLRRINFCGKGSSGGIPL